MELLYWPSENKWNLPSIDIESLNLLSYIKFSGANVKTTPTLKSLIQIKGRSLPCLCLPEDEMITSKNEIFQYLKLKHFDVDTCLSDEERSYRTVISALIEDKLIPAVQAILWLDASNYSEVVRPVFARNCRYPINFTEGKKIHDRLNKFVTISKALEGLEDEVKIKKLQGEASEVIKTISAYLQDRTFLFGQKPSSIDALLFSCLAPLLKMPLFRRGVLLNEVRKTPNLVQYVDRILAKYYKEERNPDEIPAKDEKQPNTQSSSNTQASEFDDFKYDWILSVTVATIAMASYAINSGLFTFSLRS